MHVSPARQPAASAQSGISGTPKRLVIDAPTRMFHWLFASSFVGAYVTADGDHWHALHVTLGYTVTGLLAFRILYGLLGPRHAGLGQVLRKLGGAPAWLRSVAQGFRQGAVEGGHWRQGQNLLMALAVPALLLLVVPLTLSGYAIYKEWGGYLGGDGLEDVHEFFANAVLAVVLVHAVLIATVSILRRRNLAQPMLTGRVDGAGPDLVKHNRAWLAAILLVGVLAFIGWAWQQAPRGLVPVLQPAQHSLDRHDDD